MIFSVGEQIEHISKYMTLNEGDLIFTGTPEGVDLVENGSTINTTLTDNTNNKLLLTLDVTSGPRPTI